MRNASDLKRELDRINGRGYKSYKDLEGQYKFNNYILSIDHVQGDPFAAPSRVRLIASQNVAKIPEELFDTDFKRIAVPKQKEEHTCIFDIGIFLRTFRVVLHQ